ncbi:hypothetical protein BS47DRAFT_1358079 [Hydnum rufescens UP504]|uniref:Uncharacterized protein n=1 Tax=Hydnum rufescens UP504 TaxID=1448309 RepID=A0A9P6B7Z5_9AGAM|nr:hypothetical protein BS47DRAFT_1358079 [Hydnum rufescens UP504]
MANGLGITKPSTQTEIPSVPTTSSPPGLRSSEADQPQEDQSENRSGSTTEDRIQQLEAQLRSFQFEIAVSKKKQEQAEQAFQVEREILSGSIAVLEAKLASNSVENTARPTEALLERIAAESIAAATAAALVSLTTNGSLTKSNKKHALSISNYVSAQAVERSGIIPEIVLRTARKGFFVPFADLTASQYRDYALNDTTIKKTTPTATHETGNLPKHEWLEAQTRFTQLLGMDGVADDPTIENFRHLHDFIKDASEGGTYTPEEILHEPIPVCRSEPRAGSPKFTDSIQPRQVPSPGSECSARHSRGPAITTPGTKRAHFLKSLRPDLTTCRAECLAAPLYEPTTGHKAPFRGSNERGSPEARAGVVEGQATERQTVHWPIQRQGPPSVHVLRTEGSSGSPTPGSTVPHPSWDDLAPGQIAAHSTSAQSVAVQAMEEDRLRAEDKARIVTKYHANRFKTALHRHKLSAKHPHIVGWLEEGFPLSLSNPLPVLSNSYPPNNRTGAKLQEGFVREYIADEVKKGRLVGPYSFNEVVKTYGHFFCSPLNVVEKPRVPGQLESVTKWRLIIDCSAPDAQGIATTTPLCGMEPSL